MINTLLTCQTNNNMPNDTQYPHSVPTTLQGQMETEFQGGEAKVLELFEKFNKSPLQSFFLRELIERILPIESVKWFVLDCAKFVLPVFEQQYPNDKRLSNLIKVNESYLKGNSTLKQIKDACNEVFNCGSVAAADARAALNAAHTTAVWSALDVVIDAHIASGCYWSAFAALSTAGDAAFYAYDEHEPNDVYDDYNDDFRPIDIAYMAALNAVTATSKDEMQGFVKNWIDQYFSNLPN